MLASSTASSNIDTLDSDSDLDDMTGPDPQTSLHTHDLATSPERAPLQQLQQQQLQQPARSHARIGYGPSATTKDAARLASKLDAMLVQLETARSKTHAAAASTAAHTAAHTIHFAAATRTRPQQPPTQQPPQQQPPPQQPLPQQSDAALYTTRQLHKRLAAAERTARAAESRARQEIADAEEALRAKEAYVEQVLARLVDASAHIDSLLTERDSLLDTLNATEQEMRRVSSVVAHVKARVDAEAQARAEAQAELVRVDSLLTAQLDDANAQLAASRAHADELAAQLALARDDAAGSAAQVTAAMAAHESTKALLDDEQDRAAALTAQVTRLSSELQAAHDAMAESQAEAAASQTVTRQALDGLEAELSRVVREHTESRASTESRIERLSAERSQALAELHQEQLATVAAKETIADLKAKLVDSDSANARLQAELLGFASRESQAKQDTALLRTQMRANAEAHAKAADAAKAAQLRLESQIDDLRARIASSTQDSAALQGDLRARSSEVESLLAQLGAVQGELHAAHQSLAARDTELSQLAANKAKLAEANVALQREIAAGTQHRGELRSTLSRTTRERDEAIAAAAAAESLAANRAATVAQLETRVSALNTMVDHLKSQLGMASSREDEATQQVRAAHNKQLDLVSLSHELEAQVRDLTRRLDDALAANAEYQERDAQQSAALADATAQLDALLEEQGQLMDVATRSELQTQADLARAHATSQDLAAQVNAFRADLDASTAREAALESKLAQAQAELAEHAPQLAELDSLRAAIINSSSRTQNAPI